MTLRVIPTGVYGVLDYLASGINFMFPGLLGLQRAELVVSEQAVTRTRHAVDARDEGRPRRVMKTLPVPARLAFDAAKGLFMVFSPWLFGFAKNGTRYWLPYGLDGNGGRGGRGGDQDGTLMNTNYSHNEAWAQAFGEVGARPARSRIHHEAGRTLTS